MWTLFLTNLRFPSLGSTTTAELVCGAAKLCAKWAIACLVSDLVKRIRTEQPDEGVLHVRMCVQQRLVCAAGVSPVRVIIRSPERDPAVNNLQQIQNELVSGTYRPMRNRIKEIPKDNDKVRVLGIPAIRDRVVQGALKLILEPIFEADFQKGSYGYRPKRSAHAAVDRVAEAVVKNKTRVIDLDLKAYFDNVRHDILLNKVAEPVNDDKVMRLLKLILKAGGKRGVPQGGVISPLLSNIYLNEVDKMLECAKEVTRYGRFTYIEYARFADDLVILVDGFRKWEWLLKAAYKRLVEEFEKLDVQMNQEKTRIVDLRRDETFSFLGFDYRRVKTRRGVWGVRVTPRMRARTALLRELKEVFRRHQSQPVDRVIYLINPILRGWVNYFRVGNSSECFGYIKDWVEKKIRRHLMYARKRRGFGWNRWSRAWFYDTLGLFNDYGVRYYQG